MYLSSLSLTVTFSEPNNGSFSVPLAGTAPARAESLLVNNSPINLLLHPSATHKDDRETIDQEAEKIPTVTRLQVEASKGDIKKREVWEPPDDGNKGSHSHNREGRSNGTRATATTKSLCCDYAILLELNGGNIEPSAAVLTGGKQGEARQCLQKNNERFDKKGNYLIQEGSEANIRGNSFKGRRKRGREGCAYISQTSAHSLWFLLLPKHTLSEGKHSVSQTTLVPVSQTKPLCIPMESINIEATSSQRRGSMIPTSSGSRGGRLVLSSTGGRGLSMLLGKMLTESRVAMAKAAGAARYAWGSYGEVNIQPTETQNLFLFTFSSEEIRDRIWRDRPWSLSNTLTAIERYNGRGKPENVPIEKMAMWVQIHGLHQNQRNEENMVAIGSSYFLELLDIDRASLEYSGYRRFLRILVEVDIREPIPTGFDFPFLDEHSGVEHCEVIDFKYERLVELCYFCGRIGHNWPTCRRMNEERKRSGVAYLSDVYTASLKAGVDSGNRGEGRMRQRRNDAVEGGMAASRGGTEGGIPQIPPGFTVQRVGEGLIEREENGMMGRQRGRYREGMGARDISVDLERAAEELEWGLSLVEGGGKLAGEGEGRGVGLERGGQARGVGLGPGEQERAVQTALTLGPTIQANEDQAQGGNKGFGAGLYQHAEGELEGEVGRVRKKRKGTSRPESAESFYSDGAIYMRGQEGEIRKKKGQKGKKMVQRGKRSEEVGENLDDDARAAVVRQKPPQPK
ncbi:unnamed protein product [Linum trigynum]|uniref:Zinc knuckle CX2CX4HX4C domain-containing protein n=1 Tax=Linum trigynum TaxID=586398 RepID=A0AAV2FH47_9ROSI